ncbi:unnamed protein product, partial [Rhizopus stolonifer]
AVTSPEQSKSRTRLNNRSTKVATPKNRRNTPKKTQKFHLMEKQHDSDNKTSHGNKRLSSSRGTNNYNLRHSKRARQN